MCVWVGEEAVGPRRPGGGDSMVVVAVVVVAASAVVVVMGGGGGWEKEQSGLGVLVPADELERVGLDNAIAVKPLSAIAKAAAAAGGGGALPLLPKGALRLAVSVRGDETDAELKALVKLDAVMILLEVF